MPEASNGSLLARHGLESALAGINCGATMTRTNYAKFSALLLLFAPTALAEEREFLTGLELRQALAQPVEAVSWKGKTLRGALGRITESQDIAVMLDRRVDPSQEIEFSANKVPLERMIDQFAEKYGAAACQVDSVIYVGPSETCEMLATLVALRRDEIRDLPGETQRKLLRASAWQWNRLTSPRELLTQLETEYGVRIDGKENMPHDLWPALELPPLDFASKLSLVLAGFHVTFALADDGSTVRIVAMPETASLTRSYETGPRASLLATSLAERFSDATFRAQGKRLVVAGRWEVHDAVERLLAGESVRPPPTTAGEKNYTLTVENQAAGGVVRALGNQLGKKVVFDVRVERRLTKEVSLSVKEVSLEELLSAVLSPANLKYEIDGDTIRVFD